MKKRWRYWQISLTKKMNRVFCCTQCGLCCRNIGDVPALREYHSGDGVCRFLDKGTNLCTIYKKRPLICNVSAAYDAYFSRYYTEEEFLRLNYEACRKLQHTGNNVKGDEKSGGTNFLGRGF